MWRIPGGDADVRGAKIVQLGVASSETGTLQLAHASSANLTKFQAGNASTAETYIWPTTDGSSGQVLSTNGSGVMSWIDKDGVPTTITVANEATDTSCFIAFFTAATGDLGPKTNTGLTFNSNTGLLGVTSLSAFLMAGNITFGENTSLVLDPTLSADGTYCGITEIGTGGATIAVGDLLYFSAADSRWELADASAASTAGSVKLAIALSTSSDGNPVTLLLDGKVRADAVFPTFTAGAPVYVSETAGDVTETQPTTTAAVIRIVGHAQDGNTIWFKPDGAWITHT